MERAMEPGQPIPTPRVAWSVPARTGSADQAVDEVGSRPVSGSPAYSYWAECECPGDCLRDHANE